MRGDAACARLTEAAGPEPLRLTWPVAQRDLPDRRRGRVRLREPVSPHRRGRHARRARPSPAKQLDVLGEPYRPYRSVVAWYCWRPVQIYAGAERTAVTA